MDLRRASGGNRHGHRAAAGERVDLFCLFAGAHALRIALESGLAVASSLFAIGICVILFAAMGLLFAGGFGVSAGLPGTSFRRGWA